MVDWRHPRATLDLTAPGNVAETQFDADGSMAFVTFGSRGSRVWDCPVVGECEPLTEVLRQEARLIAWDTWGRVRWRRARRPRPATGVSRL